MKRTRRIMFTKVRRQTITVTRTVVMAHCLTCQREVATISAAETAAFLKIAGRILDTAIASDQLHLIPVPNGSSRVCKESLFAAG
jgi:hypothetical protein